MQYSIGDFLDRFAIVTLKVRNLGNEAMPEFEVMNEEYLKLCKDHPKWELHNSLASLIRINRRIWDFEADLRRGQLQEYDTSELAGVCQESLLQLAAVGMGAIRIRNANRERIAVRNGLVEKTQSGFRDVKVNSSSEDVEIGGIQLT